MANLNFHAKPNLSTILTPDTEYYKNALNEKLRKTRKLRKKWKIAVNEKTAENEKLRKKN